MVVTHSPVVTQDLSWTLTVHGKEVNPQMCSALSDIPKTLSTATLQTLLSVLDKAAVCPGHPDQQFLSMLDAKKDSFYQEMGVLLHMWTVTHLSYSMGKNIQKQIFIM